MMQVRLARHTDRLEEVGDFYRDRLGLPELGRFEGHTGYDGVFIDLPGTGAHLEFTTGGEHGAPDPHAESLVVLYLGDWDAVRAAADRVGAEPIAPANPYWAENGLTFADPDGFRVVLAASTWPSPGVA
jgi:catechol 2,3-dioxygenase-like lactoylglutathione lyase family enzyme